MTSANKHIFSVAPMMDYTDRHFRYLLRLISKRVYLYTEMITTGAILRGNVISDLAFHKSEHPVAVQLGGNDPFALAESAKICADLGYDEINLNVGCPSDCVQNGGFGAALMKQPELVAKCVSAMSAAVTVPVTVKTRIGVDKDYPYERLRDFIALLMESGCQTLIMHARMAWLKGLSPKENRTIPPLDYELVYRLKQEFLHLPIIINGGITEVAAIQKHRQFVDGVMIGREAVNNPLFIAQIEQSLFGEGELPQIEKILTQYQIYMEEQIRNGTRLRHMARHLLGIFHGQPGAKQWRAYLSAQMHKTDNIDVITNALTFRNQGCLHLN